MFKLYPFLAYVVITTFTPGPNNILAMSHAMRYGIKRTTGFLLGISSGFLIVMLVCGFLNAMLVNNLPQMRTWLNILAAVYMVVLAVQVIRAKPVEHTPNETKRNSFTAGFLLQFLNPKAILFGITVYSLFVIQSYQDPLIVSLFAPLLAIFSLASIFSWALGGNLFRSQLQKYGKAFNLTMGCALIYIAIAGLV